ncbi:NUDIX domain-containing protein [Candidatus Woesearchaeota archaeon]|nr:NUDIX domain-containing protein [Candidatus Woesearchaeota archaeon]
MSELIDIINEKDEVIGKSNINEVHEKGLLHRAIHIFIIDSQGRLFCRQRSLKKERYSGYWSTSVGAHVFSSQTYDQVAQDALKNTLGIKCDLEMIGKARVHDEFENEISATYIGYSDKSMNFNPEQIKGGKFFTVSEIKELTKQKNVTPHLAHSLEIYLNHCKPLK